MHVAIGASTPIGLVAMQHVTVLQGVTMAAISAGYSLLPDVDCRNATANRALGGTGHRIAHGICATVYRATGTSRDRAFAQYMRVKRFNDPYHRTLTHTVVASVAVGLAVYALAFVGLVSTAFVAVFGVFLMWPLHRRSIGLVVLGAAVAAVGSVFLLTPWLVALAAGGGYFSHVVADACTKGGVPALWPVSIQGKRWWNIRLLGGMVTSGSEAEKGPALGVSVAANALLLFLQF
ncbi:metal-dependent hydrolase [Streptomyces sp. NPDC058947]|uniref:metal-dependent hydrolase n=1 Tax=Streptomyces sp. NPDC058947 TaxID=3346675 RepID=UPI0036BABE21